MVMPIIPSIKNKIQYVMRMNHVSIFVVLYFVKCSSLFVSGAVFGEVIGEVQVTFFVDGAVFGEG